MSLVPSRTQIRDEGTVQGSVRIVDFVGAGVSAAVSGGIATITVTGGGTSLDAITAAVADQAGIANADWNIRWNWAKTTNSEQAFRFSESAAATGGTSTAGVPNQVLLYVDTLAASTMSPLSVYSRASHVFSVSPTAAQILATNGLATAPTYGFAASTTTGMYSTAADTIGFTTAGVVRARISSNGIDAQSGGIKIIAGTAAAPALTLRNTETDGLFFGTDLVGVSITGIENSRFAPAVWQPSNGSANAVSYAINFRKSRGTVAAPTVITTGDDLGTSGYYGFVGPTNTYQLAATILGDSNGAITDAVGGLGGVLRFSTRLPAAAVLVERLTIDNNETAAETALLVSVAGAAAVRVSVGALDSGGAGFRLLRIPN